MSARDDYSKTFFEDDDWYDKAMDELDRLRAEVKLVRPVIEAAKSWDDGDTPNWRLADAVAAYRAAVAAEKTS